MDGFSQCGKECDAVIAALVWWACGRWPALEPWRRRGLEWRATVGCRLWGHDWLDVQAEDGCWDRYCLRDGCWTAEGPP